MTFGLLKSSAVLIAFTLAVSAARPQPLKKAPVLLQTKTAVVRPAHTKKASPGHENSTEAGPPSFFQGDATISVETPQHQPIVAPPASFPASAEEFEQDTGLASRILEPVMELVSNGRWHASVALFVAALAMLRVWRRWQSPTSGSRLIQEVSKLPISRGHHLQSMFKTNSEGDGQLEPGILMRVEGRVLVEEGSLAAPFSGRDTVFYSASVSHQRHDSIHQPPLAFHSAGKDFVLELIDAPDVHLHVSSSDMALVDMAGGGLEEWSESFAQAPKTWCSFVLEHLVPSTDASMHFKKCIDMGSDGLSLDFRECALQSGSHVTAVGELLRDECGNLHLRPWKPTPGWLGRSVGSADCLVGSVMISDNLALRGQM